MVHRYTKYIDYFLETIYDEETRKSLKKIKSLDVLLDALDELDSFNEYFIGNFYNNYALMRYEHSVDYKDKLCSTVLRGLSRDKVDQLLAENKGLIEAVEQERRGGKPVRYSMECFNSMFEGFDVANGVVGLRVIDVEREGSSFDTLM